MLDGGHQATKAFGGFRKGELDVGAPAAMAILRTLAGESAGRVLAGHLENGAALDQQPLQSALEQGVDNGIGADLAVLRSDP